jgi:hypothetical protein
LGVSLRTIRYWVATRRIPYFHSRGFVRFSRPNPLLESGRVDPSSTNSRFQFQLQKGAEQSSRVKRFRLKSWVWSEARLEFGWQIALNLELNELQSP